MTQPPQTVGPHTTVHWKSESSNALKGVGGYAIYTASGGGAVLIGWDNPFTGSNSYTLECPTGYSLLKNGGSGNDTTVILTLAKTIDLTAWMNDLSNDKLMTQLTIPGTHDSGARYGGDLVACQQKTIREQLDCGIRFLDVRCRQTQGSFAIHHSMVYQKIMFGDVLKQCTAFLDAHPSEIIFMSIKNEYDALNPTGTFADVFSSYTSKTSKYWITDGVNHKVGDLRGHIYLIARESGINGFDWGNVNLQDDYTVPTLFACSKKWDEIKAQLDAAKIGDANTLYANFTSGVGGGAYPNAVANYEHPKLQDYLQGKKGRLGIITMDFADETLNKWLILTNF